MEIKRSDHNQGENKMQKVLQRIGSMKDKRLGMQVAQRRKP